MGVLSWGNIDVWVADRNLILRLLTKRLPLTEAGFFFCFCQLFGQFLCSFVLCLLLSCTTIESDAWILFLSAMYSFGCLNIVFVSDVQYRMSVLPVM